MNLCWYVTCVWNHCSLLTTNFSLTSSHSSTFLTEMAVTPAARYIRLRACGSHKGRGNMQNCHLYAFNRTGNIAIQTQCTYWTGLWIDTKFSVFTIYIVTCLRHAALVETQKSVNTLRNNRGSGVFSVPCRAVPSQPHRALLHTLHNRPLWRHTAPRSFPRQFRCKHGDDSTVLRMNPLVDNTTWRDLTQQSWVAPFFVSLFLAI
jgi:hypothetical protein